MASESARAGSCSAIISSKDDRFWVPPQVPRPVLASMCETSQHRTLARNIPPLLSSFILLSLFLFFSFFFSFDPGTCRSFELLTREKRKRRRRRRRRTEYTDAYPRAKQVREVNVFIRKRPSIEQLRDSG